MDTERLKTGICDLMYPEKCPFCGRIVKKAGACDSCRPKLKPAPRDTYTGEFFSSAAAVYEYSGAVRDSVLRYKFGGKRWYARVYGALLADIIKRELADDFDIITWVPVSKARLRERGYDQARILAGHAAKELGLKASELIRKVRDTAAQSSLKGREKRNANVAGAYECSDKELVIGKRILIIDDIITTGATLSECSRTLLMAGAEKIVCATFAQTR